MDQISPILQQIAEQLGTSVQYLWPYLVDYTFTQHLGAAIGDAIWIIISLTILIKAIVTWNRNWRLDWGWNSDTPTRAAFASFFSAVLVVVSVIILSSSFNDLINTQISAVLNPQAQAVFDILAKIKSSTK